VILNKLNMEAKVYISGELVYEEEVWNRMGAVKAACWNAFNYISENDLPYDDKTLVEGYCDGEMIINGEAGLLRWVFNTVTDQNLLEQLIVARAHVDPVDKVVENAFAVLLSYGKSGL
jgi:hypothetical protein